MLTQNCCCIVSQFQLIFFVSAVVSRQQEKKRQRKKVENLIYYLQVIRKDVGPVVIRKTQPEIHAYVGGRFFCVKFTDNCSWNEICFLRFELNWERFLKSVLTSRNAL